MSRNLHRDNFLSEKWQWLKLNWSLRGKRCMIDKLWKLHKGGATCTESLSLTQSTPLRLSTFSAGSVSPCPRSVYLLKVGVLHCHTPVLVPHKHKQSLMKTRCSTAAAFLPQRVGNRNSNRTGSDRLLGAHPPSTRLVALPSSQSRGNENPWTHKRCYDNLLLNVK